MHKMKKLLIVVFALLTMMLCGACGSTASQVPADYSVRVTYCFNGGKMETYGDATKLTVFYKPNSLIANPGVTTSELEEVTRVGCFAIGWYYAKTDETGALVLDNEGNPLPGDTPFDFSNEKVTENITLVIKWSEKIKVVFKNFYSTASKEYSKEYEAGDPFKRPGNETSARGGKVENYYWSYDEATDTYSDIIEFGSLTYDDLKARIGENPEKEGECTILYVYAKIVFETDE